MTETEKSRVYCSIVVATSRTLRESVGKSRHIHLRWLVYEQRQVTSIDRHSSTCCGVSKTKESDR